MNDVSSITAKYLMNTTEPIKFESWADVVSINSDL